MSKQDKKTHHLDVDGIGHFEFTHRTMRDELRIGAEYSRLTEGIDNPSAWLDLFSTMISTLKVLIVDAPTDWEIDDADPLDPESYKRIVLVYNELREQEARFRNDNGGVGKEAGSGDGGVSKPVVSEDVQATA